jgi:hypothetical protein
MHIRDLMASRIHMLPRVDSPEQVLAVMNPAFVCRPGMRVRLTRTLKGSVNRLASHQRRCTTWP